VKALIQRVSSGSVIVENKTVGSIQKGLVVLLGVTHSDSEKDIDFIINKIVNLRIFGNEDFDNFEKSISYFKCGPYKYLLFAVFTYPGIATETFEISDKLSSIILENKSINFSSFSGVGNLSLLIISKVSATKPYLMEVPPTSNAKTFIYLLMIILNNDYLL